MKEAPRPPTEGRPRRQPAGAGTPSARSLGWPATAGTALLFPAVPPARSFLRQVCIKHLLGVRLGVLSHSPSLVLATTLKWLCPFYR